MSRISRVITPSRYINVKIAVLLDVLNNWRKEVGLGTAELYLGVNQASLMPPQGGQTSDVKGQDDDMAATARPSTP